MLVAYSHLGISVLTLRASESQFEGIFEAVQKQLIKHHLQFQVVSKWPFQDTQNLLRYIAQYTILNKRKTDGKRYLQAESTTWSIPCRLLNLFKNFRTDSGTSNFLFWIFRILPQRRGITNSCSVLPCLIVQRRGTPRMGEGPDRLGGSWERSRNSAPSLMQYFGLSVIQRMR